MAKRVRISIVTSNDAFVNNVRGETARILHELARRMVEAEQDTYQLKDANGNAVGVCLMDCEE